MVILIICVGLYIVFAAFLYFSQSKYIYYPNYPSRLIECTPAIIGLPYEDISFETVDGVKLNGWFVPAESARGTVIFCHGNAGKAQRAYCDESYRN
jgi:hypothetical protein